MHLLIILILICLKNCDSVYMRHIPLFTNRKTGTFQNNADNVIFVSESLKGKFCHDEIYPLKTRTRKNGMR